MATILTEAAVGRVVDSRGRCRNVRAMLLLTAAGDLSWVEPESLDGMVRTLNRVMLDLALVERYLVTAE
jgi:hypothetical protein